MRLRRPGGTNPSRTNRRRSEQRRGRRRFFASIAAVPARAGLVVARIMDALLVELTRSPGSNVRVALDLEGHEGEIGYPKDVVDIVKANTHDPKIAEHTLRFRAMTPYRTRTGTSTFSCGLDILRSHDIGTCQRL